MILIAVAIILLCTLSPPFEPIHPANNSFSTTPRRLLIRLSSHPQHLPHIPLLPKIPARVLLLASRPRCHNRNLKHSRQCRSRSQSRLLRHLHPARRCILDVQQQRQFPGGACIGGPGPAEPDMGGFDI
jgi:hypothetical protein